MPEPGTPEAGFGGGFLTLGRERTRQLILRAAAHLQTKRTKPARLRRQGRSARGSATSSAPLDAKCRRLGAERGAGGRRAPAGGGRHLPARFRGGPRLTEGVPARPALSPLPAPGFPWQDGSPAPPPAAGGPSLPAPGPRGLPAWEVCRGRRGEAAGSLRRWVRGERAVRPGAGRYHPLLPAAGAQAEPPRPAARPTGPGAGRNRLAAALRGDLWKAAGSWVPAR